MNNSHSARGTPLAHGKQEKPQPVTGCTFAHAYSVMVHLGQRLPPPLKPEGSACQVKPVKASPPASETSTHEPFTLRDGNVIARGLGRLDRWSKEPETPSTNQTTAGSLETSVLTDDLLRARFRRMHHKLPSELRIPEPEVEPVASKVD